MKYFFWKNCKKIEKCKKKNWKWGQNNNKKNQARHLLFIKIIKNKQKNRKTLNKKLKSLDISKKYTTQEE